MSYYGSSVPNGEKNGIYPTGTYPPCNYVLSQPGYSSGAAQPYAAMPTSAMYTAMTTTAGYSQLSPAFQTAAAAQAAQVAQASGNPVPYARMPYTSICSSPPYQQSQYPGPIYLGSQLGPSNAGYAPAPVAVSRAIYPTCTYSAPVASVPTRGYSPLGYPSSQMPAAPSYPGASQYRPPY